ncbi:adenylyltransferase/cytidyltransferase family protein [Candidatus Saccharibacteria bacterium]|nr:adenylyltransferase/cytidyltransferase family protein [Candidatus Saccharibacteria bacterium]
MKTVIVSGYFNPLHGGHLDYMEGAAKLGDRLVVIVNNDVQQVLKKGKVILDEQNRMRLVGALRVVDEVVLSVDEDPTVVKSLQLVAEKYPGDELIFANGGDRDSTKEVPETAVCEQYNIAMVFDAGGTEKADSSTRINQANGHDK